ncbi:MAG: hypothetical protein AAGI66_08730 [Cyanobacteria bacterium P01_H01_bin.74]
MIKIRRLNNRDLKQVLRLLKQYTENESEYAVLKKMQRFFIPLHHISHSLPVQWQFLPAIFVASTQSQVLGLIWLVTDSKAHNRWRIEHLILDPDNFSYDVGNQLVNYVINRYGAEGVQTFLAYVNHRFENALSLLKSCGFRQCSRINFYYHSNVQELTVQHLENNTKNYFETNCQDSKLIAELYNTTLPVEARNAMKRDRTDFNLSLRRLIGHRVKGYFYKRWVKKDIARGSMITAIVITSQNYRDFYAEFYINPGWPEAFQEAMAFTRQQILNITTQATLSIQVPTADKSATEVLKTLDFHHHATVEVLVKDYWIPIKKPEQALQSPILLFNDGIPNPAANCGYFLKKT